MSASAETSGPDAQPTRAPAATAAHDRLALGIAALLVALGAGSGLRLLQLGWRRWADVLVDFGRELYVPWRLSLDEVLYRDVAHFNGPLSPWIHAALFRVTGPSYQALFTLNLVLFALFTALLARWIARSSGALAASLALAFLVPSLGLAQLAGIANYNWISPYSHELTHGTMLGLAAVAAACAAARPARRVDAAGGPAGNAAGRAGLDRKRLGAAGLLLGLVFLTKPETTFAAALGVGAVFALSVARRKPRAALALREAALLGGMALLPYAAAVVAQTPALGLREAARATLGSWPGVFASGTADLPFYKVGMGTDAPAANARRMALAALWVAAFVAPALVWAQRAPARLRGRAPDAIAALVAFGAGALAWHLADLRAVRIARALPLITLGLALFASARALAARRAGRLPESGPLGPDGAWLERAGLAWFGCALLAKMALNARFAHYGFALAFPATAAFVAGCAAWLQPASGRRSLVPAAAVAALLAGAGLELWSKSKGMYAAKEHSVASGGDRLWADGRGPYVNACLEQIDARLRPDDTLLVLPEGIMINYLARRATPTAYVNFMPPELLLWGEDAIVAALEATPPVGVLYVYKDTREYGFERFGRGGYGEAIWAWLQREYEPVWSPVEGIALLMRRERD